MKKFVKAICLAMSLVMMTGSAFPLTATAVSDSNKWQDYLDEGKGLYLAPGADDTEMYFTWYGGADGVEPSVKISESSDMSNSKVFKGTIHSGYGVERSNHVIATGLEKGKTYYYVCSDGTTDTKVYSFSTVAENADFNAIYVSDVHITGESYDDPELYASANRFNDVLEEATARADISLVLSGGDQATEGRPCEYYSLFASDTLRNIPFAMAQGNHDVKRLTYDAIANYPNSKLKGLSKSLIHGDYYFTKGNALFLVIDSTNSSAADHFSFVKKAVRENPDAKWRIMMFHHDLYGGHIPSRESENKLLRLLFTPIIDEFQVDLVLMGHSHCYSQSHVIYKNEVVQNTSGADSITNPKGTIYLTSGSLRTSDSAELEEPIKDSDRKSEYIDTDYLTGTQSIYNILSFTDDSLTIRSYAAGQEETFNEFTIIKDSQQGGHPNKIVPVWFTVGKYIGTIYNMINNISRILEIRDRG